MSRLFKIYLGMIAAWLLLTIIGGDWSESLRTILRACLFILTVYYAFRLTRKLLRKFLWRIRRKLILSYIFIGFVPVMLLFVLVGLGFFIFMGQATSEMFQSNLDGYILQTRIESQKLLHMTEMMGGEHALRRWLRELAPEDAKWLELAEITLSGPDGRSQLQGGSSGDLPEWVHTKEFSGFVIRDSHPWIAAIHHDPESKRSIQMLVPVSSSLLEAVKKRTDADIHYLPFSESHSAEKELQETLATSKNQPAWPVWWDIPVWWLSLPDQYDWSTGAKISLFQLDKDKKKDTGSPETVVVIDEKVDAMPGENTDDDLPLGAFWVRTNVSRVYNHIFARSTALQKFVYGLILAVAIFFLIIELFSVIFGLLLARSITTSVHNLFEGTERIKKGDLNYKIKVHAQDQLGELAMSFNSMTESIKNLLVDSSEKERLAESLRIARQMQQNLLPREITSVGAIQIATLNLPAQEVCGDYYDIIRKSDEEMAIIVADVSGKGPSAALYMAEVKGVMLSVSRRTILPREVLLEANAILAPTLDSRNFITMTYALINEPARIMKLSRAGHNPILHYSAAGGRVDIVQPGGIALGMGKNGMFEKTLEEVERKLDSGDILVFYTDGLTEAMNETNQLYGLSRLSSIILANKEKSTEDIKSAILLDLNGFLNRQEPQDDVTLVLLKMP